MINYLSVVVKYLLHKSCRAAYNWWLRSPNVDNTNNAFNVNNTGNVNNNNVNNANGVAPDFISSLMFSVKLIKIGNQI